MFYIIRVWTVTTPKRTAVSRQQRHPATVAFVLLMMLTSEWSAFIEDNVMRIIPKKLTTKPMI